MKKIYLISNDRIWAKNKNYNSNNDLNNILSCINKKFYINLICRKSATKLKYLISEKFKFKKITNINEKEVNIFMISISPYNFLSLIRIIFKKKKIKGFVYLRSDGFLEYKFRYGIVGYFIYYIMFFFITRKLKVLSCSNNFTNVRVSKILHPSELDARWFKKQKLKSNIKTDFIYIGRFKKDKGSYYLIEIFKRYLSSYKLTIVGNNKLSIPSRYHLNNIIFKDPVSDISKLIDIYDSARIFILPSYIEGFPKVISESLARLKPVIIFKEIAYVVNKREGIFVCDRNEKSINRTVNYILKEYSTIQNKIRNNFFYTKQNFEKELLDSIKNEFK